jgi:hypothetical protein
MLPDIPSITDPATSMVRLMSMTAIFGDRQIRPGVADSAAASAPRGVVESVQIFRS